MTKNGIPWLFIDSNSSPLLILGMSDQKFYRVLILAVVSSFAVRADAVESQSRYTQDGAIFEDKLNLEFNIRGVQYFSESPADSNFQQQAEVEVLFEKQGPILLKTHGVVGTFTLEKSSYIAIPELFAGISAVDTKSFVIAGRKIQNFSFLDRNENLGLYNSNFTNDFINYRQQGLTGVHAQAQSGLFGVYAGYYPWYFPSQGPQVYEQNGEIRSSNRWAQRPPSRFKFGSSEREIVYAIRAYEIDEIVRSSGEGASIFWGSSSDRPWVKVSYARKPVNEIPLTRETYGTTTNFTGQVKLSPVVTYGQIQSVDINLDANRFKTTFSYLEDRVFNQTAATDETLQFLSPLRIYGAWTSADLSDFFTRKVSAEISYSEVSGGEVKDLLSDGRDSLFTFSSHRVRFKRPFTVALKSELFVVSQRPVTTQIKWTYDDAVRGTLLSGMASYQTLAKLNLNVGFDVLGVEKNSIQDNFLQDQQANDRVYGGLEYVF